MDRYSLCNVRPWQFILCLGHTNLYQCQFMACLVVRAFQPTWNYVLCILLFIYIRNGKFYQVMVLTIEVVWPKPYSIFKCVYNMQQHFLQDIVEAANGIKWYKGSNWWFNLFISLEKMSFLMFVDSVKFHYIMQH